MKVQTVCVRALNALLFFRDSTIHDIPEIDGLATYWVSASCVAFGCMADCHGPTSVTVGPSSLIKPLARLVFDGQIQTPSHILRLDTVPNEKILETGVETVLTRVRIWDNGLRDSNVIAIGIN
jgi:hypothetical protein